MVKGHRSGGRTARHGRRRDGRRFSRGWSALGAVALALPMLLVPATTASAASWGIQKQEISSGPYEPGENVQWAVTVSCSDPNADPCVPTTITDPLPDGLELVSASVQNEDGATGGAIDADTETDTVTYTADQVNNGGQVQLLITAQVDPDLPYSQDGVPITNTATVVSDNAPEQSASDDIVPVVPLVIDSETTKSIDPEGAIAAPGTPATMTIGSTNTSNDPVDTLVITEPTEATDPNPFTYLGFTGWGAVAWPAGATQADVTFTCADGSTPTETSTDADTLPDPPADCEVEGFTVEFSGEIEQGATATIPVDVEQTDAVTELTEATTVTNEASSYVTHADADPSDPTTAADTYVITPPNNAVTASKSFAPDVVSAGAPTTVTLGATNDGDPTTELTITEPSPGTASPFEGDDPLTFTGFGPDGDGTGVQWPSNADTATVTFTCADGSEPSESTTTVGTLPNPPADCDVTGFSVEFTGDIVTGATASVPFTADTDPDQTEDTVVHPNEITADIPNASDTAAADLTTLTDRLATETTKNISPSTIPALPGQSVVVQLPTQLLPFGPDGSTTDANDIVIQDPTDPSDPEPFWDDFEATEIRATDVPAGATLTISYWDGDAWVTDPDCGTFTGPTTVNCDLPDGAQGVQFAYHSDEGFPPGSSFQPNFIAAYTGPEDAEDPIANCGASSASSDTVAPTPQAEGCDDVDPFPVPTGPGDLDFIEKSFLAPDGQSSEPYSVRARTQDEITAQITWSTNGFSGVDTMVISDIADPETTAVADSYYDAFDLVRVEAIDDSVDPLIEYDAITGVELYIGGAWVDAVGDPCSVATPCDGSFPGMDIDETQSAEATSVRLTYVESPSRTENPSDPTVPAAGDGVARSTQADGRHLDLTFRLRDDKRSDGSPVLGVTNGTIYNTGDENPGLVNDTARGTATFNGEEYTDADGDDVLILDEPINVGITKEWTGGPLSVPPDGTPDSAYPSTHAVITGTNDSVARVDTLRITDPSSPPDIDPVTDPGAEPFDTFDLTNIDITAPDGTDTTTVTLTSAGGGTADYTEAEAEALTAGDLADVVAVDASFDGRIVSQGEGVLDLTLRLRELHRDSGERVSVADSPVPNGAGALVSDPGGTDADDAEAWDDAQMELQDASISLEQTKSFDPATIVEPGSDAEENPTSTLTITGQPTGPSRAVEMTLTDVDGSFWNQYDLIGLDASTLTAPIDQVQVDACTGGTYDEASDTFDGCTWTDGEPAGTFALPDGVAAADVVGLRFTFTRADGAIWENPANPTQAVNLEVQVRDTLRSDPGTPVPSDLEQNDPAPGEDAPGLATNDVTSTVTGADLVNDGAGNLVPVSSEDDASATITYQHTENGVQIVKDFDGVVTGGTEQPNAVFPMNITVTNTGNRPIYELDVVDDDMPSDEDGAQLRLAPDADPQFSYALEGAAPDPATGDPLPTTAAGTDDQVTVDQQGDLDSLEFTFPEGTVLEVGQTYTITVMVQFRVGLPANTVVENTAGVTGDRPWDLCQTGPVDDPVDGRLDDETGQCQADADVTPVPSAVLAQSKLVKATDDDELDVFPAPEPGVDPDTECTPNTAGFYAYPCTPVIIPGHDETWRIRVDNVGNLPIDKVVLYDRLPTPGDTASDPDSDSERGSQWEPILTNEHPPELVNAPIGSTTTFYYTLTDDFCGDDLHDPLNEPVCSDDPTTGGWAEITPDTSQEIFGQITAIKAVVEMADANPFNPGQFIALEGTTTTPPEVPEAGDRSIAWNSAAASGVGVTQAGQRFNMISTEGTKVGVATASGSLSVLKMVGGEGAANAPDSFDLTVECTSAVGTWVEEELDPIPITATPGVPVVVPGLPYGAECTITEDASAGQSELIVGTVTIDSEDPDDPTTITAVNRYDLSSIVIDKEVITDAEDQDGNPIEFGPFDGTVECTFLGEEVYAEGYGPDDPMTFTLEDGGSVEFDGLPVGAECTVTETGTGNASSTTITVQHGPLGDPEVTDGVSADLTLAGDIVGQPRNAVTLTNTYDVGVIDLQKLLDGEGAEQYGTGPFDIEVVCTYDDDGDGPGEPRTVYDDTVVLGGAGPLDAQIANLPEGAVCDIAETDDAGATDAVVVPEQVTVDSDEPAEVVITNTFDVGSIQVDKELAGLGALYGPGPFEVQLACTYEDVELTIPGGATREIDGGSSVTYDGLPVGSECTLTETDDFGASSTTITVDGGEPVDGTEVDGIVIPPVQDDGSPTTVTVGMTNTFDTAPLVVQKVVDGDGADFAPTMPDLPPFPEIPDPLPTDPAELEALLDEVQAYLAEVSAAYDALPYAVSLECTNPVTGPVEVIPGGADRRFGPGVPAVYFGLQDGDSCTVTETDDGGATSTSITPEQPVTIDGDATFQDPVTATVTNTYDVGSIQVEKALAGDGAPFVTAPFEVSLACTFEGADIPVPGGATRRVTPDEPATYDGLPIGAECVVTETDAAGAASSEVSTTVDGGEPGEVVVPEADADTPVVTVTNTFDVGSIAVDKVVDFEGASYDVGPFEVTLECTFQGESIEIPDGAARELTPGDPVTYDGLPIGADCVVTETDDGGAASSTVSSVDGGDPGVVTVAADAASVTVTNTFDPPPPPADGGDPGGDQADGGWPGWLPRTGTDVIRLLGLVVLLTAAGVVLVNVRRRGAH